MHNLGPSLLAGVRLLLYHFVHLFYVLRVLEHYCFGDIEVEYQFCVADGLFRFGPHIN